MTAEIRPGERARLSRLDEASAWVLRLQSAERTEGELSEWLSWIDAHPDNFAEFERLQQDWKDLDALRSSDPQRRTSGRVRRQGLAWALAAGVGAIVLATVAGYHHFRLRPQSTPPQEVIANVNHRAATLPDGSRMILGVQSRVDVDFNGPRRQLDLSAGEAYFKVKPDRTRPFVVRAGEVSVTAIGTAFDVRREREKITVTVEEGTVEVSGKTSQERRGTWRAEAGYQVAYSTLNRTASIASINPAAALAWRNGELAYTREPLGTVVENLNRYSDRKIRIEDPAVARLFFTGTAFAASIDDWLAGIEQAYPVRAKRAENGDITLVSRP